MINDLEKKIVFLDRDTLSPTTKLRKFSFPHKLQVYHRTNADEVAERIHDADIIITNKVVLREEALKKAHNLKIVAVAATGTDVVDTSSCDARGVIVTNIRGYAINTVPEHTLALIFALRRSLPAYHSSVERGRWAEAQQFCYFDYPIKDVAGSTIGIIGDGVLGRAVARLSEAIGMKVLFAEHKGSEGMGPLYTPFDEVIRRSDILTLHCPLTGHTRNLIGSREFAMMERQPLIINTARGGLVDEVALADALISGKIGGAAFDVVTEEPLPSSHPFTKLMNKPNFILTPHIAWASQEAIQGLADQLVDNIEAAVSGDPRNIVRPMR